MVRISSLFVASLAGAVLGASTAGAGVITPDTVFAVNDTNADNLGDTLASASLNNSIITRFGNRRAMAEFSLASFDGDVVSSATVAGTLDENFSFGFGTQPADFEVVVYAGNGAADVSDFQIAGTVVGTVTGLNEDFDVFNFSFDATAALQSVFDSGASHAGIRVRAVQEGVGEVDLLNSTLDAVVVPSGGVSLVLLGGLTSMLRRRRAS